MAVVACARRLRRAARRSAARSLALAILTLLLGGGAVHSTVVPEPAAPAQVQIAEVEHATASTVGAGIAEIAKITEVVAVPVTGETVLAQPASEPITGRPAAFPGTLARTAVQTRAPPQFLAA
jgi:H+/gluconate symporter-like permease